MREAVAAFQRDGKEVVRVGLYQLRRKSQTKHARRERAPDEWFEWVTRQPCFVGVLMSLGLWVGPITPCCAKIDADHVGNRFKDGGDGTRAADRSCVPVCHDHHMERHGLYGAFKHFRRFMMDQFRATALEWTLNRARQAGIVIPTV